MSIAAESPRKANLSLSDEARRSLPGTRDLSYQPVAIVFQEIRDKLLNLRTIHVSNDTNFTIAKELEKTILRLELWTNDISVRTPNKTCSAAETLQSLDDFGSTVVEPLHLAFGLMLRSAHDYEIAASKSDHQSIKHHIEEVGKTLTDIEALVEQIQEEYQKSEDRDTRSALGSVIICFDGGGIKSYSSLLIMKALMEKIQHHQKLDALRPRDFVDYMFGSSSGGLIAIMLGRLKMDINKCIESYEIYANEVFSHPRRFSRLLVLRDRTKYGRKVLERASKEVVGDFGRDRDDHAWKINTLAAPLDHCRTGVVASWTDSPTRRGSLPLPYIFRSYDIPLETSPSEQKLDRTSRSSTGQTASSTAARATSAAPGYFDPVHIEDKTFLDGGLGYNNPSLEALSEVYSIHRQLNLSEHGYSEIPSISLFISIGSGLTETINEPRRRFFPQVFSLISLLKSIATDTESKIDVMQQISAIGNFPYFRFNVDEGVGHLRMDEWKRPKKGEEPASSETLQEIRTATARYLARKEVQQDLDECAKMLITLRRLRL